MLLNRRALNVFTIPAFGAAVFAVIAMSGCAPAGQSNDPRVLQTESGSGDSDVTLADGALLVGTSPSTAWPASKPKVPPLLKAPVKPEPSGKVLGPLKPSATTPDESDTDADDDKRYSLSDAFTTGPLSGFETINVKLFPIESKHKFDPYLNSVSTRLLKLQNPSGLSVGGLIHAGRLNGKAVNFDFGSHKVQIDQKTYVLNTNDVISIRPLNLNVPTSVLLRVDLARLRRADVIGKDGRMAFRGTFTVKQERKARWSLINSTLLEDYVTSVVPSEMPLSYSDKALKVQALAARTFAVRSMIVGRCIAQTHCSKRDWDVDPSVAYQSFTGALSENPRVRAVVEATKGAVISYHHTPILAMFHANSGGKTKSAQQYFCSSNKKSAKERATCIAKNRTEYPYLASVVDPYNKGEARLGHGVGLSQHSVEVMAQKGLSIGSIVTLFYPGTTIERLPE